jgi:hypothetical protein
MRFSPRVEKVQNIYYMIDQKTSKKPSFVYRSRKNVLFPCSIY